MPPKRKTIDRSKPLTTKDNEMHVKKRQTTVNKIEKCFSIRVWCSSLFITNNWATTMQDWKSYDGMNSVLTVISRQTIYDDINLGAFYDNAYLAIVNFYWAVDIS